MKAKYNNNISIGNNYPNKREGKDGDITIRQLKGKGLFLFCKFNNIWHSTRLSVKNPKTVEDKESVIVPVGRKPGKKGEITLDTSGKTHVSKGSGVNKQILAINSSKVLDSEEIVLSRAKDSGSAGTEDFLIKNTGSGRAYIHIQTSDADADPYLLLSYRTLETGVLKQWAIGMDNNQSDKLKFCHKTSGTSPLTPSTTEATEIEMTLDGSGNLDIGGALDISNVAEIGSDTDKFLMLDSETVKYVSGTNLLNYIGAQATVTAGTNCTFAGATLNVDDAFITNAGDDTMSGTLTINKDSSATSTVSNYGQKIDLDHTGNTGAGQVITNYGLDVDLDFTGANATGGNTNNFGINLALNSESGSHSAASGIDNTAIKAVLTGDTDTGDTTQVGYDLTITGGDTGSQTGLLVNTDDGSTDLKIVSSADTADYFSIATTANGATTLTTVDGGATAANLTANIDGSVEINGATTVELEAEGTDLKVISARDTYVDSARNILLDAATDIIFQSGGTTKGSFEDASLFLKEKADAHADTAGYGQLWVHDDAPSNLYFTDDTGQDIQITSNGVIANQKWTNTSGGYKTNNNSASFYYFQYYPNYHLWGNADSSPTTISYSDAYSYTFCAPADGLLTNIRVTLRAFDTGLTDPVKFYVYKGLPGNDVTSTSLTLIGTTGAITPVALRQMYLSTDISSSNDFNAGDKLWVMYKKDSTSGNQDLYFSVSISGVYT
tara:strand:- start:21418 stop:23589 length:2172 start_codon:yes stop_codon:yes gene_type:complete